MHLPPRVELRPVADADRTLLCDIYCDSREQELADVDWSAVAKRQFLQNQFELQDRYYRAHFPGADFSIVRYNSEDVGRWYVDRQADEIILIDIAIYSRWRNRGIGSGLLRGLARSADEHAKPITLHVEVDNPARSMYERMSFENVATNGVYLKLRRAPQSLAA